MEREGTNDISRIRTFTADAARISRTVPAAPSQPPTPDPTDEKQDAVAPQPSAENPPFHFIQSHVEEVEVTPRPQKARVTLAAVQSDPSSSRADAPKAPSQPPVTLSVPEQAGPKESILSDHIRVFDMGDEGVETGTIVKETKRNRQNLAAGIATQMRGWFAHKQAAHAARKASAPKVAAPEKRIETISAAAAPGVLPEQDDHAKVKAEVQHKPTVVAASSLAITEKRAIPAPHWTYTVTEETGEETPSAASPSLTSPVVRATVTKPQEAAQHRASLGTLEAVPSTPAPKPVPESAPEQTPHHVPNPAEAAPAASTASDHANESAPTTAKPTEVVPGTEPVPARNPTRAASRRGVYVLVAASVIATFLGIGAGVYLVSELRGGGANESLPVVVSAPLRVDKNVAVPLTPNGASFRQNMATAASQHTGGVTYYYPTMATQAGTIVEAPLPDLLTVLSWRAPGSFIRSLEAVTFGTIDGTPFLLLSVGSYEVALSGMLQWERVLIEDLAPWLGTAPVSSFVDATEANQDLRVARRGDGSEVLYLFLDRTTLLITMSRSVPTLVRERLP